MSQQMVPESVNSANTVQQHSAESVNSANTVQQHSPESDVQFLLEAAERDCRNDHSETRFRDALLQHLHHQTSAVAVRLWDLRRQQEPICLATCGQEAPKPTIEELAATAAGVVDCVPISHGQADRLLTSAEVADGFSLTLEIVTTDAESARHFMEPVCEVLADLQRRILLGRLAGREQQLLRALELIALLHADLRQDRVANTLASDAAAIFDCERVSVCRRTTGGQWVLAAATSVPQPERRADAVRHITRLVEQEASAARNTDSTAEDPVDASRSASADQPLSTDPLVIPLSVNRSWEEARWAATFELREPTRVDSSILHWVCRHASVALRNSDRLQDARLTSRLMRLPRTVLSAQPMIAAGILFVAAILFLSGSTEFRIEAFGQIVPVTRSHIFTPDAGIISSVSVSEGDSVNAGQVLFTIRNDDIDLELETVNGDLAATEARLAALQSMRGSYGSERNAMLSAEQAELEVRVGALRKQSEILQLRQEELTVRAEFSGTVYGEFVREQLQDRPVQRAQHLFDIADPQSDWQLELTVPESEIRHVLAASDMSETPLSISYTLETSPEATLMTEVHELTPAVITDAQGNLSTRITAMNGVSPADTKRLGAGVIAHVHCGERSRGYVYFRKVIEFVQRQLF